MRKVGPLAGMMLDILPPRMFQRRQLAMSSIDGHLKKTQARLIVPIQTMSFLVHAWQLPFLEIFFWGGCLCSAWPGHLNRTEWLLRPSNPQRVLIFNSLESAFCATLFSLAHKAVLILNVCRVVSLRRNMLERK